VGEKKILIIEDDEDIVIAMRIVLEAHGFQVSWAENGKQGLKMVKREKPDLIILDVMMDSQTEGFHIAYTLRSNDPKSEYAPFKDIPILMVTGIYDTTTARFDDAVATEWLPVDEFIEKPIHPSQLLSLVNRMIR
jgi:two-component system alkaline phosphatase synthesis response regulator PhoP